MSSGICGYKCNYCKYLDGKNSKYKSFDNTNKNNWIETEWYSFTEKKDLLTKIAETLERIEKKLDVIWR